MNGNSTSEINYLSELINDSIKDSSDVDGLQKQQIGSSTPSISENSFSFTKFQQPKATDQKDVDNDCTENIISNNKSKPHDHHSSTRKTSVDKEKRVVDIATSLPDVNPYPDEQSLTVPKKLNTPDIEASKPLHSNVKNFSLKKIDNRNSIALDDPTHTDNDSDYPTCTDNDPDVQSNSQKKSHKSHPKFKSFPKRNSSVSDFAEIIYKSHAGITKVVQLKTSDITIGRKLESDISLHSPKVSKIHAIIKKIDNGYTIIDYKSANGVRINDRHIPQLVPVMLEHDDKINIGGCSLTFKLHRSVINKEELPPKNHNLITSSTNDNPPSEAPPHPKKHSYPSHLDNKKIVSYKTDDNKADGNKADDNKADDNKVDDNKADDNKTKRSGSSRSQKTRSILDSNKKKTPTVDDHRYTRLVTIIPSEKQNEGSVTIQAEIDAEPDTEFKPFHEVKNMETIQEDYEKLRLAYELSKSFSLDITEALSKSCEIMFEILPLDRAVVLLVDTETKMLVTHYVRVRKRGIYSQSEICLSSTILRKVYHSRKALITSDAFEDPMLNRHASVKHGQIRSVICVPLMTRDKVLGVLHLDSRNKIVNLNKKDLSLVIAVGSQTAMAIENSILVKEVEHKAKLTQQFSRFLPPYVVDKMTRNGGDGVSKGGRETFGTIVFSDIRGFTSLSERTMPSEVVDLLNDYFERLVAIVFKYDGVVDKYIGDALMAAFGTMEHERMDSEYRAVSAALEFKKAIEEMNEERKKINREPIAIGIGLNTGELLAGFIGCTQRLEYTCIGDTVNTSSRICSMAGVNQVLMSESTWEAVKDRVISTPVGYKHLKGKNKEVMVYEPICIKK